MLIVEEEPATSLYLNIFQNYGMINKFSNGQIRDGHYIGRE